MEDQQDIFGTKSESEILRNIASSVNDVVNPVVEAAADETSEEEEEKINPVVDVVSHAIKHLKPKGLFMQGVTDKETPKQS
jgi:hypothetical protein|tara:strand:- start:170 stop:412 length:243 start_codon:yes stop_codon:yes gene_type:complete